MTTLGHAMASAPARVSCVRAAAWLGVWLSLASPLAALNPDRRPDSYSIQGWSTEQGLPSNKIRAVTQTRDGYLWLATAQGIARFDGSHFTVFTGATNPELRGGGFFAVQEAPDGSLWFGGDNGVFRWRNGSFERFTQAQGLANNFVRSLALTRDGAVVVGTRTGFSIVRDGHASTPNGLWSQVNGVGRSFLERADGSMLFGTGFGLWRITGNQIEKLSGTGGLPTTGFNGLCETADGSVWIGHIAGVRRLLPDGRVEDYGVAQGLTDPRVQSLRADRDGNVWIVSLTRGLFRLAHGRIQAVVFPSVAGGMVIQQVFEDREGAVWLSAATGLFRMRDNMSSTVGLTEGLAQTSVFSVIEARDGAWWIGLWGGGVYRYEHDRAVRLVTPGIRDLDYVLALAEEPDGTLWIGANSGLYRHKDDVTTNLYRSDQAAAWLKQLAQQPDEALPGIAHPHVNSIAPDGAGGLWVGTDGALYHGHDGSFRVLTKASGLPGEFCRSVIRTGSGDIWVTAAPGGVACLHDDRWTNYLCGRDISAIVPRAVFEDSTGTIWVTTEGGGLNRFQAGRWRIFTARDGLADDFISGIAEDKLGNFWIAFPRGVMRVPRAEFADLDAGRHASLRVRVFDKSDGLPAAESNQTGSPNAGLTRDGRLLFATDGGVAVIEPDNVKTNPLVPPMHLERLEINGTDADLSQPVSVPPGGNVVQIHYTALSLLAPEKVRFKIRLAPLDRDWVDIGGRREVRYDKLPPGAYTFRAIASNNDGVWNEGGVSLAFTVRPFFYQTGWFIGLVGLTGLAGVLGVYWERARRARRQMAVLAGLVEERTRALREENAERKRAETELGHSLSVLHATLESTIDGILVVDNEGRLTTFNRTFAEMWRMPREILEARDNERILAVTASQLKDPAAFMKQVRELATRPDAASFDVLELTDGRTIERYSQPQRVGEAIVGRVVCFRDVTGRKLAEARLADTHRQLLDTSRHAGMAEVATGVLHNVGNVLNSVNVSATLVAEHVLHSKGAGVAKLAALLAEHQADLGAFLSKDPRGQMIPGYLATLRDSLAEEQKAMITELEHLRKNIEHIKEIVAMQQGYAKNSGFIESVSLVDLVEDALRMNASSLVRHDVALVRDFQLRPVISTDRHKIAQILVNLVRNAQLACDESGRTDKQVTVRIAGDGPRVKISVSDNGVGISAENLTRVFAHGFTTRKTGHGFGLHSSAIAARELGGSLSVESAGPGHGAVFVLELPFQPDPSPYENPAR